MAHAYVFEGVVSKTKRGSSYLISRSSVTVVGYLASELCAISRERLAVLDALEKDRYTLIPALMKRYYKLNALHVSQLTRYLKMCNPIECKVLEHNKMYLLQLTRMFSQLHKTLYQKRNLNLNVEDMSDKFTVLFDFRIQPGRTRSRKTRSALDVQRVVEYLRAAGVSCGLWVWLWGVRRPRALVTPHTYHIEMLNVE